MSNVMGTMGQHALWAVGVQSALNSITEAVAPGLRPERRVFQLDKRSKEVSRWRQQSVQRQDSKREPRCDQRSGELVIPRT